MRSNDVKLLFNINLYKTENNALEKSRTANLQSPTINRTLCYLSTPI